MNTRARARTLAAATAAAGIAVALLAAVPPAATAADAPWMDTSLDADERANLLLAASTQHQKYRWLNEQAANSPQQTTFGGVEYPVQVEGAPTVIYANGAEGVHSTAGTTAWPAPIAMAATWNLELSEQKAVAHGSETFDNRKAVVLGPGIASHRNVLNGRNAEYFGEDPLLAGLSAAVNVRGLEEGNPDKPVLANLKHYVANEQEFDKEESTSNIDERTLHQVYDLPYEIAVRESDPNSVMCSYNQINGIYACENPILTTNLRDDMGFTGYVMSDFGAVHSTAESLMAGLDQELNRPVYFTPALLDEALEAGEITQERIDEAAFNVVRAYIEVGLFDHPIPTTAVPNTSTPEYKELALELAEQSTVLLKNDEALPLADAALTVAVIGQPASLTATGGVSARQGCSQFLPFGSAGTVLNCTAMVDPLTAITERVNSLGGEVLHADGADPEVAAAVAADADVAIVFGYTKMGEDFDLPNLHLTAGGDALIDAVAGQADKTVVVLHAGTGVEMPWLDDVDAVFNAWYSGEKGAVALTNLLWGDASPSGKLPITFPKSLEDTPTGSSAERAPGIFADGSTVRPSGSTEIRQINYSEGLEVGYKWYDEQGIDPLFEFGYGLSYTEFGYSDLAVSTEYVDGVPRTSVGFTVTNTGDVDGAEIPQVYLTLPEAADEPGKRLVGFDRIELAAGASERVEVVVDAAASNHPFEIWDVDEDRWRVVSGGYELAVGASSRDLRLQADLVVDADGVAPIVTIAADPAEADGRNDWYVSPIELAFDATDAVDPAPVVEVDIDGAGWTASTGPVLVDADGEHSVAVRATDVAGNVSDVVTWEGKLDRTAPVVSASGPASAVVLTASDATSGVAEVQFALDGAEWGAYSAPIRVPAGGELRYRAVDVAGNISEAATFGAAVPTLSVSPGAVRAGDTVRVAGADIPAGDYRLVLRSEPVQVGAVTVSADGALSTSIVVPRQTSTGAHTLQLVAADGTVVAAAALTVESAALAVTGGTIGVGAIVFAIAALLIGLLLVALRRRRQTQI